MSDTAETHGKILYHYTSFESFMSILDTKMLFASDLRYLNDYAELQHGLEYICSWITATKDHVPKESPEGRKLSDYIKEEIESYKKDARLYVASFSTKDDQLSQWRAYCRSGGVAIGFSRTWLEHIARENDFRLCECVYPGQEPHEDYARGAAALDALKTGIDFREENFSEWYLDVRLPGRLPLFSSPHGRVSRKLSFRGEVLQAAAQFKHWKFSEESEFRLISPALYDVNYGAFTYGRQIADTIAIRNSLRQIAKIPLRRRQTDDGQSSQSNNVGITEIVVGPHPNSQLMVEAVERALSTRDIFRCSTIDVTDTRVREVIVRASAAPYRDI